MLPCECQMISPCEPHYRLPLSVPAVVIGGELHCQRWGYPRPWLQIPGCVCFIPHSHLTSCLNTLFLHSLSLPNVLSCRLSFSTRIRCCRHEGCGFHSRHTQCLPLRLLESLSSFILILFPASLSLPPPASVLGLPRVSCLIYAFFE